MTLQGRHILVIEDAGDVLIRTIIAAARRPVDVTYLDELSHARR
jgi:hypothetical protein